MTESTTATVSLPAKCKPSKVCSTDRTRPVLTHAYIRKSGRGLELHATTSYTAVRIPLDGDVEAVSEGFVPPDALKRIEAQKYRDFTAANGRVEVENGRVSFARGEPGKFPDFDELWPKGEPKKPLRIGLNAKLLYDLAQAMGTEAVSFELDLANVKNGEYRRPYRVSPLRGAEGVEGLLMPVLVR